MALGNRLPSEEEHQPSGEIGEIHPNAQTVWRKMPQCRLGDGRFERHASFHGISRPATPLVHHEVMNSMGRGRCTEPVKRVESHAGPSLAP